MGYTNYWNRTEKEYDETFVDLVKDVFSSCKQKGITLRDGFGEGEPVADLTDIWFNGDGSKGLDHETFFIPNTSSENFKPGFNFCKTAAKPYDYAVKEVLRLAEKYGYVTDVSDDGPVDFSVDSDWIKESYVKESVTNDLDIDMWYGDKFEPKKYGADAYFNDLEAYYWGWIYNDAGKRIGDYTTTDSTLISDNFQITWKESYEREDRNSQKFTIKSVSDEGTYYLVKNWRKNKELWVKKVKMDSHPEYWFTSPEKAKGSLKSLLSVMDDYMFDEFSIVDFDGNETPLDVKDLGFADYFDESYEKEANRNHYPKYVTRDGYRGIFKRLDPGVDGEKIPIYRFPGGESVVDDIELDNGYDFPNADNDAWKLYADGCKPKKKSKRKQMLTQRKGCVDSCGGKRKSEALHGDLVNQIYSVMMNYEYGYDPDMSDIDAMLQELVITNGINDIKSNAFKKAWISAHNKAERKVWGSSGDAIKYDSLTPTEQDAIDTFDEDYWKRWRKQSKIESRKSIKESFDDDWTVSETSQFYDGRKQTLRKYTRDLNGHTVLVYPKYNEKLDQIDWTVFLDGEKKEVFETSYDAIDFVDYEAADLYL